VHKLLDIVWHDAVESFNIALGWQKIEEDVRLVLDNSLEKISCQVRVDVQLVTECYMYDVLRSSSTSNGSSSSFLLYRRTFVSYSGFCLLYRAAPG